MCEKECVSLSDVCPLSSVREQCCIIAQCVHPIGLNKMYSFIVIISSTNKYRKHKSSMLI